MTYRRIFVYSALIWTAILALGILASSVFALPTEFDRKVGWEHEGCADCAGFFGYFALASEPAPRVYDNTRRVDLSSPAAREFFVLAIAPELSGRVCWKVTAYDTGGNESGFAKVDPSMVSSGQSTDPEGEEACGNFGFPGPINLLIGK